MTNAARVIVAASATALVDGSVKLGRSAEEWRNDFALSYFGGENGVDFDEQTANKKAARPRFEVHERETAKRTYQLTLMQRSNSNKLSDTGRRIVVGMFGKLIEGEPKQEAPAEEADEA